MPGRRRLLEDALRLVWPLVDFGGWVQRPTQQTSLDISINGLYDGKMHQIEIPAVGFAAVAGAAGATTGVLLATTGAAIGWLSGSTSCCAVDGGADDVYPEEKDMPP